jgi:hypothetical protein
MRANKWSPDLVTRYLEYGRNQRLGQGDVDFEAWQEVHMVIDHGNADEALELTCALVTEAPLDVLNYVAAGPVEDLLCIHGPKVVDRILIEARSSPEMRIALHGVWGENRMDPSVWKKLQAALRSYASA